MTAKEAGKAVTVQKTGRMENVKGLGVRVKKFIHDVRGELRKVSWPGRRELLAYTGVVFLSVLFVGLLLAGIDFVFNKLLILFLSK